MNASDSDPGSPPNDPVCGSAVEPGNLTVERGTETYHFCSEVCRRQFERNPGAYARDRSAREVSFAGAKVDFWLALTAVFLSNMLGVAGLHGYLVIVYGAGFLHPYLTVELVGVVLGTAVSFAATFYFMAGLVRYFSPLSPPPDPGEVGDRLRREALNAPVVLSSLSLVLWLVVGSSIALVIQPEIPGRVTWFIHMIIGNYFTGQIVAILVFYETEAIFSRRLVPSLMGDRKVSEVDGVVPVPVWVRIGFLVLTCAILPQTHLYVLYYLGDASLLLLSYFVGLVLLVAVFQAYFILRSISLPIGRIAEMFRRFQREDALVRETGIHRADDLGQFAEMYEDLVGTIQERDFLRTTFGRYMNRRVMERILDGELALGGEEQEATVLFADVRDFTSLAEKHDPAGVVDLLNDYFDRMVDVITGHEGIPDKFLGDGILAVWGVPGEREGHREKAVESALAMNAELDSFNRERRRDGREPLQVGMAVHSGRLIAGNIGSSKKMEFTVVGDTVNTCSRIESLNKELGSTLTVSEAVYGGLPEELRASFEHKPDVRLRGKSRPVDLYTLRGEDVPGSGDVD